MLIEEKKKGFIWVFFQKVIDGIVVLSIKMSECSCYTSWQTDTRISNHRMSDQHEITEKMFKMWRTNLLASFNKTRQSSS